jgi:hypothetical protein
MIPAEIKYPVHEREFLALHEFVRKFRLYLYVVPFLVFVVHRSLEHMQDQVHLSARQVRWIQNLQEFEFEVEYLPGARNTLEPALPAIIPLILTVLVLIHSTPIARFMFRPSPSYKKPIHFARHWIPGSTTRLLSLLARLDISNRFPMTLQAFGDSKLHSLSPRDP